MNNFNRILTEMHETDYESALDKYAFSGNNYFGYLKQKHSQGNPLKNSEIKSKLKTLSPRELQSVFNSIDTHKINSVDNPALKKQLEFAVKEAKALYKTKKSATPVNTTQVTPQDWKEFVRLLSTHDWTYQYADSSKDYSRGAAESKNINALKKKLSAVDLKKTETLYKKYSKKYTK